MSMQHNSLKLPPLSDLEDITLKHFGGQVTGILNEQCACASTENCCISHGMKVAHTKLKDKMDSFQFQQGLMAIRARSDEEN